MDQEQIIQMLMSRDYVSGEWMSQQMGVTRAAIWKSINALRAEGYDIQSVKKRGYHLQPPRDAVWPASIRATLKTSWAGGNIIYHPVTDSTNLRARALGNTDAPHGTLVVTDHQTAGRGRMSRSWEECSGDAVLMSLLVRPEALSPCRATGLVLITALAAAQACRDEGAPVLIKWPNDLVAGGRKLCGMLLDMSADMDMVHFAVAGVGINISGYPAHDELQHATCLSEACGHPVRRADVIVRFLTHFEALYEAWEERGIQALMPLYRELSVTLGSRVKVTGLAETFEARALDIQEDGSLLVMKDDGVTVAVRAGDVSVRGVMDYV